MNTCSNIINVVRQPCFSKTLALPAIPSLSSFQRCSSSCNKKRKALIFLPPAFEEIEVVTPADVLRRGGVEVTIAGLEGKKAMHGLNCVEIKPDKDLDDICDDFDALILTGDDKASNALCGCKRVEKLLKKQEKECKIIAAICSAPTVLMNFGIAKKKCLTSHPDHEEKIRKCGDYKYKCADVVVDDFLITAKGEAQALQWALTILMHLTDERNACCIAKTMLVK